MSSELNSKTKKKEPPQGASTKVAVLDALQNVQTPHCNCEKNSKVLIGNNNMFEIPIVYVYGPLELFTNIRTKLFGPDKAEFGDAKGYCTFGRMTIGEEGACVAVVWANWQYTKEQAKVGGFVADIRAKFKEYLRNYLETHFAETVGGILHSEQLWQLAASLIPRFRPELENLIRTKGSPLIIEKLDIEGRIKTAVDAMDVKEFHGMVNEVAAQHLGAIQVLGYLLGALAGALLLLVRF